MQEETITICSSGIADPMGIETQGASNAQTYHDDTAAQCMYRPPPVGQGAF